MANEHLKNALHRAGLTIEQFAEIINVDPKTVQRWVAGRTPYPRHRATIARSLELPENELWPDDVQPPAGDSERERLTSGDVAGSWGRSNHPGAPAPITFLSEGAERVEILDTAGARCYRHPACSMHFLAGPSTAPRCGCSRQHLTSS